jgi:hypothetical protein
MKPPLWVKRAVEMGAPKSKGRKWDGRARPDSGSDRGQGKNRVPPARRENSGSGCYVTSWPASRISYPARRVNSGRLQLQNRNGRAVRPPDGLAQWKEEK